MADEESEFDVHGGEIDADPSRVAQLLDMIQGEKVWIDGRIDAPAAMFASGDASGTTGMLINEFSGIAESPYVGVRNGEYLESAADMLDITVRHRLPGFIALRLACCDVSPKHPFRFEVVKELLVKHVAHGYHGFLCFYIGKYDTTADLHMTFEWKTPERVEILVHVRKAAPVYAALEHNVKQLSHNWLDGMWGFEF